jgi:alkylhydroperoxidase family enzyme
MARIPLVEYEESTGKIREAFDYQIGKSGSISNMKRGLLQDIDVYDVNMGWYTLYARLGEFLTKRETIILCHSISTTNGCLLCSLFFISDLKEIGEDPHNFELDEREALLAELGSTIVKNLNGVSDELYARLQAVWTTQQIVVLVGFAAQMIATNIFNSVFEIDVDDRLLKDVSDFEPETWRQANA